MQERQDVLQLIAEPERSARLVRTTPRPDPATERLIQQPSIDEKIERIIRCLDLNGAENLVPETAGAGDGRIDFFEARVAMGQRRRVRRIAALTENERDAAHLSRRDIDPDLQSPTGVEPGTGSAAQPLAEKSGRRGDRAIPPDEVRPIACERDCRFR